MTCLRTFVLFVITTLTAACIGQPDAPQQDAATTQADAPIGSPPGEAVVNLLTPSELGLAEGVHEVRYTLSSSSDSPIAVKKVEIFFYGSNAEGATPWYRRWRRSFESLRFMRDGAEVDPSTYRFVGWQFPMSPSGGSSVTVEWMTEEEVSHRGHTYTLAVPLTGAFETGDSLRVELRSGNSTATVAQGRLTPNGSTFGAYLVPGPHVWIGTGQCVANGLLNDGDVRTSSFVWSNRSSAAHSWADCTSGASSTDWFTGTPGNSGGTYTLTR